FPPLVDDPATFGRIAATNALNDVFAMGGSPLLALSIAAFPEELPTAVLGEVFAAAAEQVRAAGAILAGGHTIRDLEPKYGLALGYDAQTAGGLLVSLPSDKALSLASEFDARGLYLARVGAVEAGSGLALNARLRA